MRRTLKYITMGGDIKHYLIIPEVLRRALPAAERALFDALRQPVCECSGAIYGFARAGRDFIMSFAGWLIINWWLTEPEAPALHVLWHDGDDAGALRRAIKTKEYIDAEVRAGRNAVVKAAENFSAEPWLCDDGRMPEPVADQLAHARSVAGRASRCAVMATYVDDCDLDAAKPLRSLVWRIVRVMFLSLG